MIKSLMSTKIDESENEKTLQDVFKKMQDETNFIKKRLA